MANGKEEDRLFEDDAATRDFEVSLKIASLLNGYCASASDVEELFKQAKDILKLRFTS